jgi:hypothetical protein
MASENTLIIEVTEVLVDSGKALKVSIDPSDPAYETTDDGTAWVPQSQIHEDSEVYQMGDSGSLVVTRWIAEQKGWW